jgi:Raf kinase inhibitor-like YbhB/YbcL family protein
LEEFIMILILSSPAFEPNGEIPADYTCEGKDISPPLVWQGIPAGTRSLALIVDDPDAPDPAAPKMTWVHWILFNLPPTTTGLPAGTPDRDLPVGTQAGVNDFKRTRYGGPCPPIGRHRYFHKLYALDAHLNLETPTKAQVEAAMTGHILAQAELMGTYQKQRFGL